MTAENGTPGNWWVVIVMVAAIVGLGQVSAIAIGGRERLPIDPPPALLGFDSVTELPEPIGLNFPGVSRIWTYVATDSPKRMLAVVFYQEENQGRELVSSGNSLFDKDRWVLEAKSLEKSGVGLGHSEFSRAVYRGPLDALVTVFSQYRFTSFFTTTQPLIAKTLALRDSIIGANASAQIHVVFLGESTEERDRSEQVAALVAKLLVELEKQLAPHSS